MAGSSARYTISVTAWNNLTNKVVNIMAVKKDNANQKTEGNVDQIREILFGGHLRAFDERFELVESRLAKETEALRKVTEKKFQDLERLAAEVREEASDRLGVEANSRDLALNKLELALGQSRADAENQMASMEDRFSEEFRQVRTEIKALHKELSSALAQADRTQTKSTEKLGQDMVAREDLSELFRSLAQNLQPEQSKRDK